MGDAGWAAYDELIRRSRERGVLASCAALLGWDEQTYMPRGGGEQRGQQLALLAGLQHERATDPALGGLLAEVEGSAVVADPESPEAANVRELRRSFDRQTKLPRTLVEELAARPRAASRSGSSRVASRASPSSARAGDDRQPQARGSPLSLQWRRIV